MIRLLELGSIPLVLCRPWSPSNWPTGPLNLDGGRKEACPVKCVGVITRYPLGSVCDENQIL